MTQDTRDTENINTCTRLINAIDIATRYFMTQDTKGVTKHAH